MTRFDVVTVALRLFALAVLFSVLQSSPRIISAHLETSDAGFTLILLTAVAEVVSALLILRAAPGVAVMLLPRKAKEVPVVAWSREDAMLTGVVLIGLLELCKVVSDATYWIVLLIRLAHTQYGAEPLRPERMASIVSTIVEGAFAGAMVFRPAYIVGLIRRNGAH